MGDQTLVEIAKFIGTDGSMGFRRGQKYRLEIFIDEGRIIVIHIRTGKVIPYDTFSALVKNWDFVKP